MRGEGFERFREVIGASRLEREKNASVWSGITSRLDSRMPTQ